MERSRKENGIQVDTLSEAYGQRVIEFASEPSYMVLFILFMCYKQTLELVSFHPYILHGHQAIFPTKVWHSKTAIFPHRFHIPYHIPFETLGNTKLNNVLVMQYVLSMKEAFIDVGA